MVESQKLGMCGPGRFPLSDRHRKGVSSSPEDTNIQTHTATRLPQIKREDEVLGSYEDSWERANTKAGLHQDIYTRTKHTGSRESKLQQAGKPGQAMWLCGERSLVPLV